jgi:hypothetical protein
VYFLHFTAVSVRTVVPLVYVTPRCFKVTNLRHKSISRTESTNWATRFSSLHTCQTRRMCVEVLWKSLVRGFSVNARVLRVMTFNIRGSFHDGDGINVWNNRSAVNVETIKRYAPHVIGFQELQSGNLDTYEKELPEYVCVLGPEAGNKPPHEFNAIFYDPTRLEVLASGGF